MLDRLAGRSGDGFAEVALFLALVFLTGIGFLCFGAGALMDAAAVR